MGIERHIKNAIKNTKKNTEAIFLVIILFAKIPAIKSDITPANLKKYTKRDRFAIALSSIFEKLYNGKISRRLSKLMQKMNIAKKEISIA